MVRVASMILAGAVIGLLITVFLIYLFVDMDMLLIFYIAGIVLGGVLGGIYSVRAPRTPTA